MNPTSDTPLRLRKIPQQERRYKFRPDPARAPLLRLLDRLRGDPRFLRRAVQAGFVLLSLWIGAEFWLFMRWGMSGGAADFHARPPGAEAFLPISGLLGLLHWMQTGELNRIHPAATVILVAIVVVSVVVRKSFCSWICPIGTFSDGLAALGRRIFGQTFALWKWLDRPLRLVKYALLIYFAGMLATMGADALGFFVQGPYNRMADVKMYEFFANITPVALLTVLALLVGSVLINRFWCRYLCPYGALLGLVGMAAPLRVTRLKARCIDCELCTRACPSNIAVHRIGIRRAAADVGQVWSDECTTCMRCVDECPVRDTLVVRARHWPYALSAPRVALVVSGVFVAVTGLAMLTGHWRNAIPASEYLQHFRQPAVALKPGPALPRR